MTLLHAVTTWIQQFAVYTLYDRSRGHVKDASSSIEGRRS